MWEKLFSQKPNIVEKISGGMEPPGSYGFKKVGPDEFPSQENMRPFNLGLAAHYSVNAR